MDRRDDTSAAMPAATTSRRETHTAVLEPRGARPTATEAAAGAMLQEPVAARVPPRRFAIIVCHGMGQQVNFETLECLAETLRRAAGDSKRDVRSQIVRLPQLAAASGKATDPVDLRRAEIDFPLADGAVRPVHLYEAYWAPLTEGQVSLKDVFLFLLLSGRRGLLNRLERRFERWMFGQWVPFPIPPGTPIRLALILVLVLALAAINAVLVAVVAARLTGAASRWPGPDLFRALTSDVAVASLGVVAVAAGVLVLPRLLRALGNFVTSVLSWAAVYAGFAAVAVAGVLCAVHVVAEALGWKPDPGWLAASVDGLHGIRHALFVGLVWIPPFLGAAAARWFLVQYVGDVVAYVSSHSVNRFHEIRRAIQEASLRVGSAVYRAVETDGRTPLYTDVLVMGHSLGSVVAYDMLNALITQDRLDGDRAGVLARTKLFLTFGSPLNKTAFLFRTQRTAGSEVRETMAAAVQPLISSYDNRTFPWVNLYSVNDWIGGPLRFYDTAPPHPTKGVRNVADPDARTPLAAHGEHWKTKRLAEALRAAIVAEGREDR